MVFLSKTNLILATQNDYYAHPELVEGWLYRNCKSRSV